MTFVPQWPKKVQALLSHDFSEIDRLCEKSDSEKFVGGRRGYQKSALFQVLLIMKVMGWSMRRAAETAGISHSTLVRVNEYFLRKKVYERYFAQLVKKGSQRNLFTSIHVALDSSFVHTFSKKGELGSEGWNEYKKGYGFKLHLLVDTKSQFPLSLIVTNGNAHDGTLAIPLLKKARSLLRNTQYVLADKAYDDQEIVQFVNQQLQAKAGIPIKRRNRGKNYSWTGSWRHFQLRAKGRSIKHSIYQRRTSVERVFSFLKRIYGLGKEETRGILNFAKNVYLSLICYTLQFFNTIKSS